MTAAANTDLLLFDLDAPIPTPGSTRDRWERAITAIRAAGVTIYNSNGPPNVASAILAWHHALPHPRWTADGEPTHTHGTVWWNHDGGAADALVAGFAAEGFHVVWDGSDQMAVAVDEVGAHTPDPRDPATVRRILHDAHDAWCAQLDTAGAPIAATFATDGGDATFELRARDIPGLCARVTTHTPAWQERHGAHGADARLSAMCDSLGGEARAVAERLAEQVGRVATVDQLRAARSRLAHADGNGMWWHLALDCGLLSRADIAAEL